MNIGFIIDNMQIHSGELAIVSDGKEYTFQDIFTEYEHAIRFLEEYGIKQGQVIALLADFTPVSIALMIALVEKDVIIVPISKTIRQIDSYLRVSETEVFIDASGQSPKIKRINTTAAHPMLLHLKEKGHPGLILFSSGTTGEPKAALHDLTYLMEKFKKKGKVLRTITFLLFDHIGGFNTLFHALANGGTMITVKTREPEEICQLIEKYQVELLPTSPTFINMILMSHAYKLYDLSCLKLISYGTEPMPESTLKQLNGLYPDINLKQTYGLSEVGIMATKSESSDSLWMKLGGEGYETKIVNDILYIRAKSAMIGYLNAPSPFDEDGWFNTKDKVLVRGEYLKILGRTTDLINVGGEKVYPIEVESTLMELDEIKEVRVYGENHPLTGKMVVAELYVDKANQNREFIKKARKFCKNRLEKFKIPAKFTFVDENLHGDRFKKKR